MSTRATQVRRCGVGAALASALVTVALLLVSVLERLDVRADLVGLGQRRGSADSLGDVVTGVAACGLAVAVTGLAVSLLVAVADVMAQERWSWLHQMSVTWCPAWGRRLVLSLCGVGMVLPATAASSVADDRGLSDCRPACSIRVDGLPMPDLPTREPPSREPHAAPSVVVRPGDCLWTIAERELPPRASDAAVSGYVDAWYAANAATIGPDPDLILPGSHLDRPEASP